MAGVCNPKTNKNTFRIAAHVAGEMDIIHRIEKAVPMMQVGEYMVSYDFDSAD